MSTLPCRLYAVSSGDGNNGVSHMFPDYYVYTNDPFRLAELAMVDSFKSEWMEKASEMVEVDGESDYTISAVIYDYLDREYDADSDEEPFGAEYAPYIYEVFADDEGPDMSDPWHTPLYYSLESCFSAEALALVKPD